MAKQKQYFECKALDFKNVGYNILADESVDFNQRCANGNNRGLVMGIVGDIGSPLDANERPVYHNPGNDQQYSGQANWKDWWTLSSKTKEVDVALELMYDSTSKLWQHKVSGFWPLNDKGWDTPPGVAGSRFANGGNNGLFTLQCSTQFVYTGGETFTFNGDDDVWIFVDGKLAVDLGGIHAETAKSVNLDDLNTHTSNAWDMKVGCRYKMNLFFAERCCCASNFNFDTSLTPVRETEKDGICPNTQMPGKFCTADDQCKQLSTGQYFCYKDPAASYSECTAGTRSGGVDQARANADKKVIDKNGGIYAVNGTMTESSMSGKDIGILIGIICGSLLFLVLLFFLIVWIKRRRNSDHQHHNLSNQQQNGAKTIVQAMEMRNGIRKGGHGRQATFDGWIKHIDEGSQRYEFEKNVFFEVENLVDFVSSCTRFVIIVL